jgi:hypothetical protein
MPFLFERAYRRMGRHYFLLYVAFEFDRAVAAARDVAEALAERFGPEPSRLEVGIGVNSGPVVVGSGTRAMSCCSPRRPAAPCRTTETSWLREGTLR